MTFVFRKKGKKLDQRILLRGTMAVGDIVYFSEPGQGGIVAEVSFRSPGRLRSLSKVFDEYIRERGENQIQYWGFNKEDIDSDIINDFGVKYSVSSD